MTTTRCPGCRLDLPAVGGPSHRYLGASPECWALFGRVLASHFENGAVLRAIHRLVVDAYAAQHPEGQPDKSLGVHLVGLQLSLVEGMPEDRVNTFTQQLIEAADAYPVFVAPANLGKLQRTMAKRWAISVWEAWRPERAQVATLRSLIG